MAVLCCAGSGEVDIFAFGYERNITTLVYLYCERYIAFTFMRHSFPCAYKSTIVVGIVGIVNELVTHSVAAQIMRVAIWIFNLDGLEIRP